MTTLCEYMERMDQVLQNNGITIFLLFIILLDVVKNRDVYFICYK
jgi:hypothetical protein